MSSPVRPHERRTSGNSSDRPHSSSSETDDQIHPAGPLPYHNYGGYESRKYPNEH
jgi:hypothetical protein